MTSTLDDLLSSDIWDTRDLIQLIEELDPEDPDEAEDLVRALALQEEVEPMAEDYKYGAQVIHENHFEDYAQDFADDIGAIDRDCHWPNNHIDWKAAADELSQDYVEFDFEGNIWLVR